MEFICKRDHNIPPMNEDLIDEEFGIFSMSLFVKRGDDERILNHFIVEFRCDQCLKLKD